MISGETNPFINPVAYRSNFSAPTSKIQNEVPKPKHIKYYAIKTASVAIMVLGAALSFGAAAYVWPIASRGIAAAFSSASTADLQLIGKIAAYALVGYVKALAGAASIGGDIGGWVTLGVAVVGGAIVLAPVVLTYGLPVLPGYLIGMGGYELWKTADKYK